MAQNNLKKEVSLYLRQHQDNPVHWYSWGDEAFKKAHKENKPVFISIGYSTCHWCHVMEKESFENDSIAHYLNDYFISIKVDREEFPDIDQFYMDYCIGATGRGGWPLSVWVTADKKPFFVGTYFPPLSNNYSMGFLNILKKIKELWDEKKDHIEQVAEKSIYLIEEVNRPSDLEEQIIEGEKEQVQSYIQTCLSVYDQQYAGFSDEPKFPQPYVLWGLLNAYTRNYDEQAWSMVRDVLKAIRNGGIYDHIGGGIHRYSTDKRWFLPHFEKMLYDQAGVLLVATRAYSIQPTQEFEELSYSIVGYVMDQLKHKQGAFFCAQDADSDEDGVKKEGAYYVWEQDELKKVLSEEEYKLVDEMFGVQKSGNVDEDPHHMFEEKNVFARHYGFLNNNFKKNEEEKKKIKNLWTLVQSKLKKEREKRKAPAIDNKILTDWNALMVIALCRAGVVFKEESWVKGAEEALRFIKKYLYKQGKLYHRFAEGQVGIEAYLLDNALLLWAVCEMFLVTQNTIYIDWADELFEQVKQFQGKDGSWENVCKSERRVPIGQIDKRDGAMISTRSALLWALERYSQIRIGCADIFIEEIQKDCQYDFKKEGMLSPSVVGFPFLKEREYLTVISQQSLEYTERWNYLAKDTKLKQAVFYLDTNSKEVLCEKLVHLRSYSSFNQEEKLYVLCKDSICLKPQNSFQKIIQEKERQGWKE